ncbi:MAG: hypothetical protein AAFQ91_25155 [Cyanobacteria bacterium J06621_15]
MSEIKLSITNMGGYIGLNWSNTGSIGKYDYVALYADQPTDPRGYLTWQWQWASRAKPYKTGTRYRKGVYWLAYCSWDYAAGCYRILHISPA